MSDHICDTGNFDRTLCAEPCGRMHSYCDTCGERQDPCDHDTATPDETPRATLREDEQAVAEVLAAHEWASPPIRCTCGWEWDMKAAMAAAKDVNELQDVLGSTRRAAHRAHVAEHLAPLLAAAHAAGVMQERDRIAALIPEWQRYAECESYPGGSWDDGYTVAITGAISDLLKALGLTAEADS